MLWRCLLLRRFVTFNSLYLGFSLASCTQISHTSTTTTLFQFPLLGIFPCISLIISQSRNIGEIQLSIPFTWDFPLHPHINITINIYNIQVFQFPLLGIFPCIRLHYYARRGRTRQLSIPFTWDFPLHLTHFCWLSSRLLSLSIPFTWDFPLHHSRREQGELTQTYSLSIPFTWDFPLHLSRSSLSMPAS